MKTRFPIIPLSILAALPALARAEGSATSPDLGGGVLQMLLALTVVILLLFGSLYLLKRLSLPRGAAASLLRVVAGTAVGTRERVVVVEIGDTWLVLGVAPGHITPLHQLPRQALSPVAETSEPGRNFAGWLKQVMEQRNATS